MNTDKDRRRLRRLLSVLVDEWGFQIVTETLNDLQSPDSTQTNPPRVKARVGEKRKLLPHEIADSALSEGPKKSIVVELARRFEAKSFLPTIGDVREFFFRFDRRASIPASRSESFRAVLKILLSMPDTQLRLVRDEWEHSGPSELKPLSDAINVAVKAKVDGGNTID